jgi:hypothetical protein
VLSWRIPLLFAFGLRNGFRAEPFGEIGDEDQRFISDRESAQFAAAASISDDLHMKAAQAGGGGSGHGNLSHDDELMTALWAISIGN